MKPIGKQNLLILLVIVLVVINMGLVAFMWYTQRPDNNLAGPASATFLIKELGFDKAQEQQYLQLQRQLRDSLGSIQYKDRQLHDRFFEMMHAALPDSAQLASIIDSMGKVRGQIEYFTFIHFRHVRAICNAEQQQKFDRIIAEAMRRMGPHPAPGQPRRPGGPPNGPPPPDDPQGPAGNQNGPQQ